MFIRPGKFLSLVLDAIIYNKGVRTSDRKIVGTAVAVWLCRELPYRDRSPRGEDSSPRMTEFGGKFAP